MKIFWRSENTSAEELERIPDINMNVVMCFTKTSTLILNKN